MPDIYFNKNPKRRDDYDGYNESGDYHRYEDLNTGRKKSRARRAKAYDPNDYAYNDRSGRKSSRGDVRFDGRYNDYIEDDEYYERQRRAEYQRQQQRRAQQRPAGRSARRYDDYDDYGRGRRSRRRPRKRRGCLHALLSLLLVFVILYAGVCELLFWGMDYAPGNHKANNYVSAASLKRNPLITNILLVGVDAREGDTTFRSDTMMLITIDRMHMKIKLTSFLRDSYVEIPGYGKAKLNAACSYNGVQGVIDTIEYNYGIRINKYIAVDFSAFTQLIDGLGGVDVPVTEREANYLNNTWSKWSLTGRQVYFQAGESVHMDGEMALMFCRIRYLDSDVMRTKRQRLVIAALKNKLTSTNPLDLVKSVRAVAPNIQTDMLKLRLGLIGLNYLLLYHFFPISQTAIPVTGTWYDVSNEAGDVVSFDVATAAEQLKQFIYHDVEPGVQD